jgi:hypothetical protein
MLVYYMAIWYILWPLGTFCGHLVYLSSFICCNNKNLATLVWMHTTGKRLSSSSHFSTIRWNIRSGFSFILISDENNLQCKKIYFLFSRMKASTKKFVSHSPHTYIHMYVHAYIHTYNIYIQTTLHSFSFNVWHQWDMCESLTLLEFLNGRLHWSVRFARKFGKNQIQ